MRRSKSQMSLLAAILALQCVAAAYFIIDGTNDLIDKSTRGFSLDLLMDWLVPVALIAGIIVGVRQLRYLSAEIKRANASLEVARGALAGQIAVRFSEWGLTSGEADVALFAMKGCSVAEIADLRGAAMGTVRAQLSQIYAKAGVSSQSMLVSLFIEDLLDSSPDSRLTPT